MRRHFRFALVIATLSAFSGAALGDPPFHFTAARANATYDALGRAGVHETHGPDGARREAHGLVCTEHGPGAGTDPRDIPHFHRTYDCEHPTARSTAARTLFRLLVAAGVEGSMAMGGTADTRPVDLTCVRDPHGTHCTAVYSGS